jgi:LmbE family N-acetylglucosaminyl deacetylase
MNARSRRWLALLLGNCILAGCASESTDGERQIVDLLVFAPHPDDEALGCAGILRQALASGKRVKIAVFTNGDGFPGFAGRLAGKPAERLTPGDFVELARYRQSQSIAALKALGGRPEDLVFLGYPDSGLTQVYQARSSGPFRQKFTERSETYGVAKRDYHTDVHGRAAPYTRASALGDVVELIRTFRPSRICVTSPADSHPDHQAAFRFVKDGIEATGFAGIFETYLIHGGPEWPWPPGVTPHSRFEAHPVKGEQVPRGVPWPPSRRVDLSPEEVRLKHAAIRAHMTHLAGATEGPLAHEKGYLESFVKSEEVFWSTVP